MSAANTTLTVSRKAITDLAAHWDWIAQLNWADAGAATGKNKQYHIGQAAQASSCAAQIRYSVLGMTYIQAHAAAHPTA